MGADGHLLIIEVSKVQAVLVGRDPGRLGWNRRTLLGREVLWRYWDTEGRGDDVYNDPRSPAERHHQLAYDLAWLDKEGKDQINVQGWRVIKRTDVAFGLASIKGGDLAEAERWVVLGKTLDAAAEDWQVWT